MLFILSTMSTLGSAGWYGVLSEATALRHHGKQKKTPMQGVGGARNGAGFGVIPAGMQQGQHGADPPHSFGVEEGHVPHHRAAPVVADEDGLGDALRGGGQKGEPRAGPRGEHPNENPTHTHTQKKETKQQTVPPARRGAVPSSKAAKRVGDAERPGNCPVNWEPAQRGMEKGAELAGRGWGGPHRARDAAPQGIGVGASCPAPRFPLASLPAVPPKGPPNKPN